MLCHGSFAIMTVSSTLPNDCLARFWKTGTDRRRWHRVCNRLKHWPRKPLMRLPDPGISRSLREAYAPLDQFRSKNFTQWIQYILEQDLSSLWYRPYMCDCSDCVLIKSRKRAPTSIKTWSTRGLEWSVGAWCAVSEVPNARDHVGVGVAVL